MYLQLSFSTGSAPTAHLLLLLPLLPSCACSSLVVDTIPPPLDAATPAPAAVKLPLCPRVLDVQHIVYLWNWQHCLLSTIERSNILPLLEMKTVPSLTDKTVSAFCNLESIFGNLEYPANKIILNQTEVIWDSLTLVPTRIYPGNEHLCPADALTSIGEGICINIYTCINFCQKD